jgi:hypothetical protein
VAVLASLRQELMITAIENIDVFFLAHIRRVVTVHAQAAEAAADGIRCLAFAAIGIGDQQRRADDSKQQQANVFTLIHFSSPINVPKKQLRDLGHLLDFSRREGSWQNFVDLAQLSVE